MTLPNTYENEEGNTVYRVFVCGLCPTVVPLAGSCPECYGPGFLWDVHYQDDEEWEVGWLAEETGLEDYIHSGSRRFYDCAPDWWTILAELADMHRHWPTEVDEELLPTRWA